MCRMFSLLEPQEQKSQDSQLLSTHDTPGRPQASGLQVFFWGNVLLQRVFFLNVLYDLQKVAALTSYYVLDYFLPFLHLSSGKEIQTIRLSRYFPLERIMNIKLNQLCSPFYTQHSQQ